MNAAPVTLDAAARAQLDRLADEITRDIQHVNESIDTLTEQARYMDDIEYLTQLDRLYNQLADLDDELNAINLTILKG